MTTDEERILVKSDSFINLTEVTNFMPSKNIYFSDPARELDKDRLLTPDYYYCNEEQLPTIDKLVIEDELKIIGKCQYLNMKCNEVVLPDTLIEVKLYGLSIYTNTMILPNSLEIIGDRAFTYTYIKESELNLPINVKYIGYEAFSYCSGISGELVLPESLEYLGERAFYWCDKLSKVVDNSKIKTISSEAFSNCWILTNYVFNNVLERIEYAAFAGTHMRNGNLPDSLKHIGEYALYVNEDINVVIPEGIEEIRGIPFFYIGSLAISRSPKYTFENGYLIRTEDRVLMSIYKRDISDYIVPDIELGGLCDQIYEECIRKGIIDTFNLTINSSIKEYKYDKPIMEKGHIVIPEHVTEQPIFNVEIGGGFIYESAVPPKMPDTESLRMDGKEIIVPKGSIDAYKQAFSKYANDDELIAKLVEAQ